MKVTAFALMIAGVALSLIGLSAMSASSGDPSRYLADAAPDHTRWILLGGIVIFVSGIGALFPAFRKREEFK